MKGWRGESRRHALASRGISTSGTQTILPTATRIEEPSINTISTGPITWNTRDTGVDLYNYSINNPDDPNRHYDVELVNIKTEKLIELQKFIIALELQSIGKIDSSDRIFKDDYKSWEAEKINKKIENNIPLETLFLHYDKYGDIVPIRCDTNSIMMADYYGINEIPVWIITKRVTSSYE